VSESSSAARRPPGAGRRVEPETGEDESDPELAAAIDSFASWAESTGIDPAGASELPPLRSSEPQAGGWIGDYELVRRIGVGGMGIVFEARQRHVLGRRVALKVLRSVLSTEDSSRRFRREVAAAAALDHPAIVPVVDARVDDGTPYYVMKFVEGLSAAALLRELRTSARIPTACAPVRRLVEHAGEVPPERPSSGPESTWEDSYPRWIARLGLQLAEALEYAHERGLVHRDVKPGNVLLTPHGRAVLVDFGLVSAIGDEALTRPGEFLGTLGYAAPEQLRGLAPDARSDVYSLGATLYELLSLARPFGSSTDAELLSRVEREDPAPLRPPVPRDLATIVGKALARVPARRYATAGAMAQDLRAFLAGLPIQARPPGPLRRLLGIARRNPAVTAALLGVLLTLGGLRLRAHARVTERVALGQARLAEARQERAALDDLLAEHERLLGQDPRAPERLQLLREEIARARTRAAGGLDAARVLFEQAFEHVAGASAAHEGLADLAAESLRQALRDFADVRAPGSLAPLEAELLRHDGSRRHAALVDPTGRITLTSEPSGASVRIEGPGGTRRARTPLEDLVLPEGSYTAWFEAAGRAPVTQAFLVRRAAADERGLPLPARVLAVALPPADRVPEGFAFVPGGETLVDDDPPRWEQVGSFFMQVREVTWSDLAAWANAREAELGGPPVLDVEAPPPGLERVGAEWRVRGGVDGSRPVLHVSPMEILKWAGWRDRRVPGAPPGWVTSLPTRAEWVRAARGADGRPYPWGWEFHPSFCAGYGAGLRHGNDVEPVAVGTVLHDRSPFGIQDLAGSAAELTCDLLDPRPGELIACGGSYRCDAPEDFRVTTVHKDDIDEPRGDVGFRLVLRPPPAELVGGGGAALPWGDDFARPDSEDLGGGWLEFAANPHGMRMDPGARETCAVVDGRLRFEGGVGNFSDASVAYHPIAVPPGGCTVRAVLRGSARALEVPGSDGRAFGVTVCQDLLPERSVSSSLTVSFRGSLSLTHSTEASSPRSTLESCLDPAAFLVLELELRPGRLRGRAWPERDGPAAALELALEDPRLDGRPAFVGFVVPNQVGATLEVESIEVRAP